MNQENTGKFIRELRKKHGMTQKEFADSLGVTYQAVSKWENGKNMPDIAILKFISEKYNVDINELLEGKKAQKNKKKNMIYITVILVLLAIFTILLVLNIGKDTFKLKGVTSACEDFKLTGAIAYDKNKSSFYISNIEYCGEKNTEIYSVISCTLYEKFDDTTKKISDSLTQKNITIEEYMKTIELKIDNYKTSCKEPSDIELYLEINATTDVGKSHIYKIPLKVEDQC